MNKILKKILTAVAVIMLVAGLGFLLFPPVSNTVGTHISKMQTQQFDKMVESIIEDDGENKGEGYQEALKKGKIDFEGYTIDETGKRTSSQPVVFRADLNRLYADSVAYNENLKANQSRLLVTDYAYETPALNLENYGIHSGIYGYVSAPSIDMELPIYLGAQDTNMSYGAAHLTYTSLPIGGSKTNTAIAGHTGYVGRVFFDNIRNLEIGDKIYVKNYWDTLTYTVQKTEVVTPTQSGIIFIDGEKDLLTLVTCISDQKGGFNRYCVVAGRD